MPWTSQLGLVRATQHIQVMSLKCYPLCFRNDVSIFYMCFLSLSLIEQLLTEFVFSSVTCMFIYAGNCIYFPYDAVVMSQKCLNWELCHIKLECDWLLCCWLLAFALAVEEKLNEECILFSYSQLFLITTSLSWASVFHNIFFNCKWTVDLSFFCPVHVKKWIFFYIIFLYLLYLAVLQ